MQTLILIVDAEAAVEPADLLDAFGETHWTDGSRKVSSAIEGWLAVSASPETAEDYDPGELDALPAARAFYVLESSSDTLLARYVAALAGRRGVFIDNDHGWIAPAADYGRAIADGAEWLRAKGDPRLAA